jgi:hypothetical protein
MENDFWRLGPKSEVSKTITLTGNQTAKEIATSGVYFLDEECRIINDVVWVPLKLFCERTGIPLEIMFSDPFLETLNMISKRKGYFPIQKIEV